VLVLNATYEPINVCSVRRAAVLLLSLVVRHRAADGVANERDEEH